ncbi:MAG: LCP family protein [Streptosporangiaceae bacterium]
MSRDARWASDDPTHRAGPTRRVEYHDEYQTARAEYGRSSGRPPRRPQRRPQRGGSRHGGRRVLITVVVVILALVVGGYAYLDSQLGRVDALADYSGRPAATPGQDWLLVGSDSREGLTAEQRKEYSTGGGSGQRTDTIMLLHIPSGGGKPTLVSLPRDSYVPIAGHGHNKLNAAFAWGGPRLLARTVESVTGIRVDHYAEVGFGGFVGVVDAVGGVKMCIEQPINDRRAGINLKKGCQKLNGAQALGYVRSRHAFASGDFARVTHQRKFLGALFDKAASPGVLLNPFRVLPLMQNGVGALTVADGDHLYNLVSVALAMRSVGSGDAVTTTVPVAGTTYASGAGSVVEWNRTEALRLFNALKEDKPVPKNVLSDSP